MSVWQQKPVPRRASHTLGVDRPVAPAMPTDGKPHENADAPWMEYEPHREGSTRYGAVNAPHFHCPTVEIGDTTRTNPSYLDAPYPANRLCGASTRCHRSPPGKSLHIQAFCDSLPYTAFQSCILPFR